MFTEYDFYIERMTSINPALGIALMKLINERIEILQNWEKYVNF